MRCSVQQGMHRENTMTSEAHFNFAPGLVSRGACSPERNPLARVLLAGTLLTCVALTASNSFAQVARPATHPQQQRQTTALEANADAAWQKEPLALLGAFEVQALRETITDDARSKDLQILLRWPKLPKDHSSPLPLVVFSHGMGGDREAFTKLSEHWTSHGFVVVHVTHSDSIKLRREQGEKLTLDNAMDVRNVDPESRIADCLYLAEHTEQLEQLIASQEQGAQPAAARAPLSIDTSRVYVAGHSAGALTTMLCINVKARMREAGGRPRDMLALKERGSEIFKAGIVISGQGTTNRMLIDDSWNALRVPMLVLAGSKDVANVGKETPESRRHPFEKSKGEAAGGPPAWLLWIEGATHGSYQGKDLTRMLREDPEVDVDMVAASTRAATLAFLLAARDGLTHKPQLEAALQASKGEETTSLRAARLLRDEQWMPSITDKQATMQVK
jgi:dienelactone hydrolase